MVSVSNVRDTFSCSLFMSWNSTTGLKSGSTYTYGHLFFNKFQCIVIIDTTTSYRFMVDFSVTLVVLTINLNEIKLTNANCHRKHDFKYCSMLQTQYTHLPNILVDSWFSTSFDAQLLTVIVDTTSTRYICRHLVYFLIWLFWNLFFFSRWCFQYLN